MKHSHGWYRFDRHRNVLCIEVYVQPNARRTEVVGRHDESLKVRVAAPPLDQRANVLPIEFLKQKLEIPASRIAITRFIKRGGKLWVRIFPDKPVTKKPAETRMGKGKGAPEFWVAVVKPGRILFEMEGVPEAEARQAMRLASHKLPLPTQFVARPAAR